jgi:putative ABC transport system permease protein
MKFTRSFKIALNIILHSKLRSWLTILGIVIGIAAVVSIVSIGQGAEKTIQQNLNSLSADIITINPGFSRALGAGADFRGGFGGGGFGEGGGSSTTSPKNLTSSDVILLKGIPNVLQATGIISGSTSNISFIGKTGRASIEGVDPAAFKDIISTDLASGRYLSQGDVNVVVVGGRVANSTFSGMEINRQITIGGRIFRIVGILKESGGSDDSKIFMPIENAVPLLDSKYKNIYDSIIVKIKDISITDSTVTQITNDLMLSHGILQTNRQDFSVTSPQAIQARVTSTLSSATLFLTAIAIISLIVGAIGIMNTMFTSVLEKTKDIGILKALGAKNRDILTIFLFNAGIIGFIGGVVGIIFGIITSGYISSLSGTSVGSVGRFSLASTYVSPTLIIEVFVLSILVGLISGAIPAYRASRLKPVDALRYE